MQWFDIGANLTDKRLADTQSLLHRSSEAGVDQLICIGANIEHSQQAIQLAKHHQEISATVGIHPHYAKDAPLDYLNLLRKLAVSPGVVAIGECGLDFNRNFSPKETQLAVFEAQLALAAELQLPIYLHERDAFDEQIALLRQYRPQLCSGVVHCFTGNTHQLEAYLELDFHIGITGWLCDPKRAKDLREAVKRLPLERLLLETDAPYLTPKSVRPRPKNNSPEYLPLIAQELSEIWDLELAKISQHSYSNALQLFNLPVKTY